MSDDINQRIDRTLNVANKALETADRAEKAAQEASRLATETRAEMLAHERVCDERFRQQQESHNRISSDLREGFTTLGNRVETMRETIGTKVTEVHDRVDKINEDAMKAARADALEARGADRSKGQKMLDWLWKIAVGAALAAGGAAGMGHLK